MFKNKVVLITGASSGIGAATAILFAKEGANLAIVGRNETKLAEVARECQKVGVKPLIIKADVSKDIEAKTIVSRTIEAYKQLDVLVNNAGILRYAGILEDNTLEVYDEVMNTNMRAVVLITNLAAPYLVKTKGNIVNVSSVAGKVILGGPFISYSVSKAGLDHFTRGVAVDLAAYGVRVNSVNPGPVETDIFKVSGNPGMIDDLINLTAFNKKSDPEEVGDLIVFLASDKAKSITGCSYVIDNGLIVKKV